MSNAKIVYRVGDVVARNGVICKVTGLGRCFGLDLSNGEEDVFTLDVEPIPLTDDILSKLGFEYSDFLNVYKHIEGATYDKENKKLTINDRKIGSITLKNCIYLHQIGRAFEIFELEFILGELYHENIGNFETGVL